MGLEDKKAALAAFLFGQWLALIGKMLVITTNKVLIWLGT